MLRSGGENLVKAIPTVDCASANVADHEEDRHKMSVIRMGLVLV